MCVKMLRQVYILMILIFLLELSVPSHQECLLYTAQIITGMKICNDKIFQASKVFFF